MESEYSPDADNMLFTLGSPQPATTPAGAMRIETTVDFSCDSLPLSSRPKRF
jgi:hypothetical protein